MIDGIKIACNYLQPEIWLHNDLLMFPLSVNEKTGEILQDTRVAKFDGLKFKITPSQAQPNLTYCNLEGSLHKYHNRGEDNANDFTGSDLNNVIADLHTKFEIEPDKSIIHNIEFGVNIELPIKADQFLKYIISAPDKRFSELNVDKIKIGKICSKSEYDIKVYNKARQCNTLKDNLIRIELKVKKMRWLQNRVAINTLSSLQNPKNLTILGRLILEAFENLVIYDQTINHNQLNNRERLLIKDFQNPIYWEGLGFKQRYKKRKAFTAILKKYNSTKIHNEVLTLIKSKLDQLNNNLTAENRRCFHHDFETKAAEKQAMFSPLECRVKTSPGEGNKIINVDILNKLPGNLEKLPKNHFCKTCGKDISNQKPGSMFCSERLNGKEAKKCRNKASGKARTERNQAKRQKEALQLTELLNKGIDTGMVIKYTTNDQNSHKRKTAKLYLSKLQIKAVIYLKLDKYEFTSYRARKLLNLIIQSNENKKT